MTRTFEHRNNVDMTGIDVTEFEPCLYSEDEISVEIEDLLTKICEMSSENSSEDNDDDEVTQICEEITQIDDNTQIDENTQLDENTQIDENTQFDDNTQIESVKSENSEDQSDVSSFDHTRVEEEEENEATLNDRENSYDSYSETEDLTTLITQTIRPDDDDYRP